MNQAETTLHTLLKKQKYSITQPRLAVFTALWGQEPLSMHELVAKVQGIDRASVYRAVALFEELGVVHRINIGWKYKLELSEAFTQHHHHLSCIKCGKTTPINEAKLETLIEQLSALHHFTPTAHQIEIQGYCQECKTT